MSKAGDAFYDRAMMMLDLATEAVRRGDGDVAIMTLDQIIKEGEVLTPPDKLAATMIADVGRQEAYDTAILRISTLGGDAGLLEYWNQVLTNIKSRKAP